MHSPIRLQEQQLAELLQQQRQEPAVKAMEQLVQLRLQVLKDKLVSHPAEQLKELQAEARALDSLLRLLNPKIFAAPPEPARPGAMAA